MNKLRVLMEQPPPARGDAEQQVAELRTYISRMVQELQYLFEHLDARSADYDPHGSGLLARNTQDAIDELAQGVQNVPTPYPNNPAMDPTDTSRAAATDLSSHVGNTGNPHGVTKAQVGLDNVANERQYSAQNPPPAPTPGDIGAIPATAKGSAGGVAELDSNGMVPSAQLPSYVDDVQEYASLSAFPVTGESGKIYVALDTGRTYRWSGSAYTEISESLALGETSSTAYRGDRGKTAYDHSQITSGNPHNVSASDVGAIPTTEKGAASGVASLGSDGKVPSEQLPAIPTQATATPLMDGLGYVGDSAKYAKEDHVHPSDTAKANYDTEIIVVNMGTVSSLPKTVSNAKITADHVVVQAELGTPAAQTGDWTVTTSAGSVTLSGTISGSTTVTLVLGNSGGTVS